MGRLLQESYSAHKHTVWAERSVFSAKYGGKAKVHLQLATKSQRGSRCIAVLFL